MKTLPKGHVSILSPAFKWTPPASTDLAKTFARIKEQQRRARELIPIPANVRLLKAKS